MKKMKLKQLIDNDKFENRDVKEGLIQYEYEEEKFVSVLITEENDVLYPGIYDENEYKYFREIFGEERTEEIKQEALNLAIKTEWLEPTPEQKSLEQLGLIFLYDEYNDPWLKESHNL